MPANEIQTTSFALAIVLTLVNAGWLFSTLLGIPGTWLMVMSTTVVAWLQWQPGVASSEQMFAPSTLLSLVFLAALGELLEFMAGAAGAKKAGGTARSAVAAIVGGVVGAIAGTFMIPIPLVGSLIGAAGGAGLAAGSVEMVSGRDVEASMRIGMGAGMGRLIGTLYKLVVGIVIWVVAAVAAFWP